MKNCVNRMIAVGVGMIALAAVPMISRGQATGQAANGAAKLEAISKQLSLTPAQKEKLLPILAADAPKLKAIKENTSLTNLQKLQQLRGTRLAILRFTAF